MFKIKICGVTSVRDASLAVSAGADAVGLNFYPLSRRCVTTDVAQHILLALPAPVIKVGVFVNASVREITDVARQLGLECVQLHGDEPAELLAQLPSHLSILRAYRCGARGLAPLAEYLENCRTNGRLPDAVLIDSATAATGEYGGTGRVADWDRIAEDRERLGDMRLILAGGLTPANVAEAIAAVRPNGVDVASGVECRPGHKDAALVEQFVAAAHAALACYG
jgi:phosphoribosylanthranilate isomerase